MNITNISKKKFNSLQKLNLEKGILSTEAQFYLYKKNNKNYLYKKFYIDETDYFRNKIFTIDSLIENKEIINIPELVLPKNIISVDHQLNGYIMEYINGTTLSLVLKSNISIDKKMNYLKKIGIILEKMKNVRKYTKLKDFYLGDMHEHNFIITKNDDIKVIDTDSIKINGNNPQDAKYLYHLYDPMYLSHKYQPSEQYTIIPNQDTDYYCYNIMILNTLANINISKLDIIKFYDYLNYLLHIGINKELVDSFSKLYTNANNDNPYELLESIDDKGYRANFKTYSYNSKSF